MSHLNPNKLHVNFIEGCDANGPIIPRAYTLTHSDTTGDLFLTIGQNFNIPQISGFYTRLMRDEVLAKWQVDESGQKILHVHCHVSGGLVLGPSKWRAGIFRYHLPMVLEAFHYGDKVLLSQNPDCAAGQVIVHFHAKEKKYNQDEAWGVLGDYKITV